MSDFEPYYLSHFTIHRFVREEYQKNSFPIGAITNYLALMIRGEAVITTAAEALTVHPGELFYLPQNHPYTSEWFGDPVCEFYSLGFRFADPDRNGSFSLQKLTDSDGSIRSNLPYIHSVSTEHPMRAIAAFYELYDRITQQMIPLRPVYPKNSVMPALRRICGSADSDCSVPELARLCSMSESSFYEQFRRQIGMTPIEYKNQFRCRSAAHLLATTDYTVDTVASLVGYTCAGYLRRQMKQTVGKTPSEIRREKSGL